MNKCVLITGGAKGLGKAMVESFAKNSYDVVFTYNNSEKEAVELKDKLKKLYDVNIDTFKLDVTKEEDIQSLFKNITRLDCLINNAAFNCDNAWQEKSTSQFNKILSTNVTGPFLMCQKAHDLLEKTNGNIINIASTNGIDTMYSESMDYDASKAALINLTKNLASTFAPNIRVNAIAPGWINTESTIDMFDEFKNKELDKICLNRFAEPVEIANVAVFLASNSASYINGSIIRVDGGVKYGH